MIDRLLHIKNFFGAACVASCFFFCACENDLQTILDLQRNRLSVDEANLVESYMSQGGVMRAKLTAPRMLRYQDSLPRVEFPQTLHVDFYDDSLRIESMLDAAKGWYYETQNRIVLTDSVVVIRLNGDTLRTKELYWEQSLRKFFTHSNVAIHSRDKIIYGKGFEADDNLLNWKIDSTTGFVQVGQSKFPGG